LLLYKANAQQVLERLRAFWHREMPDQILAVMSGFPNPYLEKFQAKWNPPPQGAERQLPSPEETFDLWDAKLRVLKSLEDDSLPVAYATLDFGESGFAAFLGAEIHFYSKNLDGLYNGGTYSWAQPLLDSWQELEKLSFSLDNPWVRRFRELLAYFIPQVSGRLGINVFLCIDALTLACELRGTSRAYLDLYEHPQELRRVMEIGVEENIQMLEMQYQMIEPFQEGRFTWIGGWVPHSSPVPLSVDTYILCAPWVYRDFGLAYQQRLIDHFGAGFMHFHGPRLDLLPEVLRLQGLMFLEGFDSGRVEEPRAFEILPQIKALTGDMPLLISCTQAELMQGMHERSLPGGVMYRVGDVSSIEEANRLMEEVRRYRAPG